MSSINKDLETVQKAWFENNLRPWLEKRSKFILENKKFSNYFKKKCIEKGVDSKEEKETLSFTEPFYTAFLDNQGHDKTVMFVGKETHGFGNINDNDEPDEMGRIRNTHQWMLNTMKVNIRQTNCVKIPGINYNTHPFFRAMRAIAQKYNVCWNNLDKIQYVSENVKSMTLYEADELELNSIIKNTEYNTLLIEEINAIQPDMIVFAVGPSY